MGERGIKKGPKKFRRLLWTAPKKELQSVRLKKCCILHTLFKIVLKVQIVIIILISFLGLVRRQPNNFQRMVDHPLPSANASSQMSLKVKMSNMNLSKMSAYSNYSMFSNESNESLNTTSNTEPTEKSSIHTMTESVTEDTTSPISPSSIKLNFNMMKKSQSMVSSSSSSKVKALLLGLLFHIFLFLKIT